MDDYNANDSDQPLLNTLLQNERLRTDSLLARGKAQIQYPLSNEGWIKTLFILSGRSLGSIAMPWTVVVVHSIVYTAVYQHGGFAKRRSMEAWELFFSFVLNSTLSLLLVFRLNRAASRFWFARQFWGDIVARGRSIGSGILVHGSREAHYRDEALKYLCAFAISTKEYLRGSKILPRDNFAGILNKQEVANVERQSHPPLYAADRIRYSLGQIFCSTDNTNSCQAIFNSQHLQTLEEQLNQMIWSGGGLERIKSTPLPIVYVSHLRTFLLINLILFPWVFGPSWGWSTVPIVAVSAFAWLGLESAAVEVECPFRIDRANALNMDSYVIGVIASVQQQLQTFTMDNGLAITNKEV